MEQKADCPDMNEQARCKRGEEKWGLQRLINYYR